MQKFILGLSILLCLVPSHGNAASDIQFKEAETAFSLPDAWDANGTSANRTPPKMDPGDPLIMSWKRAAIIDSNGTPVSAGLNIVAFNVPADTNVALASSLLMHRRGWPFKQFLTSDKDGLVLPNSLGYLTEFSPSKGLLMKMFVIHSVNNGKFIEVALSATDGIFPQVEEELRFVLKSLHFVSNGRPHAPPFAVSRESVHASQPEQVAVTSIKAANDGARIVAFSLAPVSIATFLRQLENAGVTKVRLTMIEPVMACGRRVMRAEFQISGDTKDLIDLNSSAEQLDLLLGVDKESSCISILAM